MVLPDPISKDRLSSYHTQSNSFETYSKLNNKVDDLLNKYGLLRVFLQIQQMISLMMLVKVDYYH